MEKVKNKQNNKQQNMPLKSITINLNLDDELINFTNKNNQYTIPIFIPHRGCKNDCVFCNQRKISGMQKDVTCDDVQDIINNYVIYFNNIGNDKKIEVAFFGGSFTGIPLNEQIEYLQIANKFLNEQKIHSIRISTRPDYINTKILNVLKKYNVSTIELGVQSMKDDILKKSKRGHTRCDVIRASKLIQLYNINLGHQIMIGLPESITDDEIYTIKEILKLKPVNLRIYPVYVIEQSELYNMYESGIYTPLELQEAIDRVYKVVNACKNSNVKIIRLGLQSTDEITQNNSKIAGPVCDNFAEYVMAKMVQEKIEKMIIDIDKYDRIEVRVPKKYISISSGPKKINKIYFKEKYNIELVIKGE